MRSDSLKPEESAEPSGGSHIDAHADSAPAEGKPIGPLAATGGLLILAALLALLTGAGSALSAAFLPRIKAGGPNAGPLFASLVVDAGTESIEFATSSRPQAWRLPPGTYSLLEASPRDACGLSRSDPDACILKLKAPGLLTIQGGAKVRLDSAPGRLVVTVTPRGAEAPTISVRDRTGRSVSTAAFLGYESTEQNVAVRFPIVADGVTLGGYLADSSEAPPGDQDLWQAMLVEGRYEIRGAIGSESARDSFLVQSGSLDPGDVVEIGDNCLASPLAPAKPGGAGEVVGVGSIRGVASVELQGGQSRPTIQVSLVSCLPVAARGRPLPALTVRNFGSTEPQNLIMPSRWVILGQSPAWLTFWLMFGGAAFILQLFISVASYKLRGTKAASEGTA